MIQTRRLLGALCWGASALCLPATQICAQTDRPNIIVMMADDMGWGGMDFAVRLGETAGGADVMYNGTTLWDTPNLAAMANNGLAFSRMYSSSPVCSPTRASVMTGRSPERIGIPFANQGKLENREVTVAEYAQALGYTTGMFGKWHLGVFTRDVSDANRGGDPGAHAHYSTPLNNGFDVEYATESKTSTYNPGTSGLTVDTRYWTGPGAFVPLNSPDLQGDDSAIIVRETNAFIDQAVADGEPFLAVSWFHTPHKPTNTPGNTDVNNLPAYKFAMEDLDAAVGEIRAKVQQLGIADNTILLFTSDNGPEDGQTYNNEGLRNNKRELHEGGVRVPGIIEWQGEIAPGVTHTPMVTTDYLPTLMDVWGIDAVDGRPMDGTSMSEVIFNDRAATRDKTILFKSTNGHQSAMGVGGRYKLISTNNGGSWELYDILVDYDENNALATSANIAGQDAATQQIYNTLMADYNAWAASVQNSTSNGLTGDYETRVDATTGIQLLREPPEDLGLGDVRNNTPRLYLERQHATVRSELTLDSDGTVGTFNDADSATLAAGTVVNSYLVHFDPSVDQTVADFQITFDDPIVGVIGENALLAASDSLSFADPNFESSNVRGLESPDQWTISNDGLTIDFSLRASIAGLDHVRILTRSSLNDLNLASADLDGDGDVDDADFGIAFAAFTGPNNGPSSNPDADLDGDGDVDDADFGIAFAAFTGPSSPVNIPEPASAAVLTALFALRRRH